MFSPVKNEVDGSHKENYGDNYHRPIHLGARDDWKEGWEKKED